MITQTVTVTEKDAQNIIIGRKGTYDTEEIVFDLSYLIESYGAGTAVLMAKRSQDSTAYPVSGIVQDDSTLTWTVSATDTNYKGHGECELYWYVNNALAKSVIWTVTVLRDIGDTSESAPDPYETWVDTLTALGAETLTNAQNAAQSEAEAKQARDASVEAQHAAEEAQRLSEEAQEGAETAEENSEEQALKAEGYAVGQQNGVDIDSTSPYYRNNAKHYAEVAQQGAEESGYAWFDVHDNDGYMYVYISDNLSDDVSFAVNEAAGQLEVTYH